MVLLSEKGLIFMLLVFMIWVMVNGEMLRVGLYGCSSWDDLWMCLGLNCVFGWYDVLELKGMLMIVRLVLVILLVWGSRVNVFGLVK